MPKLRSVSSIRFVNFLYCIYYVLVISGLPLLLLTSPEAVSLFHLLTLTPAFNGNILTFYNACLISVVGAKNKLGVSKIYMIIEI